MFVTVIYCIWTGVNFRAAGAAGRGQRRLAKGAQKKCAAGLAPRTRCRPPRSAARRGAGDSSPLGSASESLSRSGAAARHSAPAAPSRRSRPRLRLGPGAARLPLRAGAVAGRRCSARADGVPRSGGPLSPCPSRFLHAPLSPQEAARRASWRPPRPPPLAAPPRVRGPARRCPRRRRRGWTCRAPSSGSASTKSAPR